MPLGSKAGRKSVGCSLAGAPTSSGMPEFGSDFAITRAESTEVFPPKGSTHCSSRLQKPAG